MRQFIYADHAATTKLDTDAFEAMKPYFLEEYGNASQPYAFARPAKKAIKQAREIIASCINAEPEEIFFTSGGTESDNWAIKGTAVAAPAHHATITSQIEHHAVLNTCQAIEKLNWPVMYLPVDATGRVLPSELAQWIKPDTRLVSVMMVNNEVGTIQPIKELAEIAHAQGAVFHTDAVQAVGHIPVDVKKLGVDLLSASAHKFNGPKGVGFLYVKKGTPLVAFSDGGAQESGRRAGTENTAGIVGMAAALRKNCYEMEENAKHLLALEQRLLTGLAECGLMLGDDYIRNGGEEHLPGLLSLSFPGKDGEALLHCLDLMGICVSTGSACDSKNTQISHVLRAIGLDENYAKGTVRISLGKANTEEEVLQIAKALHKTLR